MYNNNEAKGPFEPFVKYNFLKYVVLFMQMVVNEDLGVAFGGVGVGMLRGEGRYVEGWGSVC